MSSLIKKVAPIALSFIPGVGPLAGAALGAGLGAMGGGGLKGALLGGAGGYLGAGGGGLASAAGSAVSKAVGLGGTVGSQTIGNALSGALLGGASGGLKGALLGGVTGGVGANAGDISKGLFGSPASTPLAPGVAGPSAPATSGIISSGGLGNALSSSLSGAGGDLLSSAGSILANNDAEEELRKAQLKSQQALDPFLSAGKQGLTSLQSGFDPSQIQNDAGYQFRLNQGNQALERSLAARGLGESGAALKAAQDYGQGLASQSYNDAYNQWFQRNAGLAGYGANATNGLIDTYGNLGNIGANSGIAQNNILQGTLSNILGRKSYIDANGKVVYLDDNEVN